MRLGIALTLLLLASTASPQANMTLTVYVPYEPAATPPASGQPGVLGAAAAVQPTPTATLPEANVTYKAATTTIPEARILYTAATTASTSTTLAPAEPSILGAAAKAGKGDWSPWDWLAGLFKKLF